MKKKDCAYTRKNLPRYLTGHLFGPQRQRIERHLRSCPVCSSEYDALRRIDETRSILREHRPFVGCRGGAQAQGGGPDQAPVPTALSPPSPRLPLP